MRRRRVVQLATVVATSGVAGCLVGGRDGETPIPAPDPAPVTTVGGDDVVVVSVEVVHGDDGHRVSYGLRNDGERDATVEIRTVLRVDGGRTFTASAYTDVAAGQSVAVTYPVVGDDTLTTAERERLFAGEFDVWVYVNGEPRTDGPGPPTG